MPGVVRGTSAAICEDDTTAGLAAGTDLSAPPRHDELRRDGRAGTLTG
ncbi:hypothetical protein ABIB25_001935 [Nakamurella sp. UYEF19]